MRGSFNKKIGKKIQKAMYFLIFLLLTPISYSNTSSNKNSIKISNSTAQKDKINTSPAPLSLDEQIKNKSANPKIIEIFDSTLFNRSAENSDSSSFMWLHNPKIKENRSKILGIHSSTFETWWKIGLDGFLLKDRLDYTEVIRTRINSKVLTKVTDSFFIQGQFELLTGSGSIQKIYQRLGETNGISQLEVLLLWKATKWLTIQFGAINQDFLQSPLLLANIPFPSVVENIELFQGQKHNFSLSFQQAIPTTFSDSHSIYTQSLSTTPLLITKSLFWNYDPKSYYTIALSSTFFHFNLLPSDIALASLFFGNTIVEEPAQFKYHYTGFYIGLEPSFQIFPTLALKLKIHYINNIRDMDSDNLNQGMLYSLQTPFDITENIRVTPVFEYFINQPDTSVGYYNSERYGHSDRTGFVGELIFNFYNRNMEVGFRHLRSRAVRTKGLKQEQVYYLLFLRTNYVKI